MTRGEARVEMKRRGFDYLLDARCDSYLNSAKDELEDYFDWPWLETTTTGTAPLAITNVKRILYVVDDDNDSLLAGLEAGDVVEQVGTDIAETGTPIFWWLDGQTNSGDNTTVTLKVFPVQAVSLSVRHTVFSDSLVADSESPLIPSRYHHVWIDLAVVAAYKDSDNFEQATALRQDVMGRIGHMIETLGVRNLQNASYQHISSESLLYGDW